jgi:hypothetical protein
VRYGCPSRHDISFDVAGLVAGKFENPARPLEERVETLAPRNIGQAFAIIGPSKRQDRLEFPSERQRRLGGNLV